MGRMEDMKHYASDVVAGATIGWIIGRTVGREGPLDENAWQVVPFGRGLAMTKSFEVQKSAAPFGAALIL